ncbi:MAG: Serine/threonine-protein kinase PknD [Chroococcopsis gigantea SAG 12.99]|nr:Serine/threonine-protein kinase PknD [Chroococcopsis gigantea SAG 12.99]
MLYCSNPLCPDPFNFDDAATCSSCGYKSLSPIFHHRYKVIKILGEGGFGRTYQALDIDHMSHPCVIKQLTFSKPQALQKARALFQQEAKRLYDLGQHRQIPSFLAYFEENNKLYLVQEYIEGKNLYTEFQEQGKFTGQKIIQLLKNFLPILQFIHDRKIIHRDIKPENIMRCDADDRLVLIDFGIAKEWANTIGHANGTVIGTPGYAPLEQIAYGQVSPSSDLYSLGITCIRLITGEFIMNDLQNSGGSCRKWSENLPVNFNGRLVKILDKLIEIEPGKRYQHAEDVIKDLECLNTVIKIDAVVGEYTRSILTGHDKHEVGGIILREPNHKELVRIAKASVLLVEERWQGKRTGNGSGFLYKQIILPEKQRSRCYFLTALNLITGVFKCPQYLNTIASSGKNIESIKLQFVAVWNQKQYSIDKFLIPKNTISEILTGSGSPHLTPALFHLDIDSIEILDFFSIASGADPLPGDKLHAFGCGQGQNLTPADDIIGHVVNNRIIKEAVSHNIAIGNENWALPTVNELGAIVGISTRGHASSVRGRANFFINIYSLLEKLSDGDNWQVFTVSEHLQGVKQRI